MDAMEDAMDAKEGPVQSAKYTFYEVLRGRLAALNPDRTIVLRGTVRPGVLMDENELVTTVVAPDCFRLQWGEVVVGREGELPDVTMQCEVSYETAGTVSNGGMDRGRLLGAMDAELYAAVTQLPQISVKKNYAALANGGMAVAMQTNVWWGPVAFGKTVVNDDRLARTATVEVMSYQEAGER